MTAPSIQTVVRAVCAEFSVTQVDLNSERTQARLVEPRHAAFWLSYRLTGATMAGIGRAFGDRDHTTVGSALKRFGQSLESSPILRGRIARVLDSLGEAQTRRDTIVLRWPIPVVADTRSQRRMRACIGPKCLGEREFLSSNAAERLCPACRGIVHKSARGIDDATPHPGDRR